MEKKKKRALGRKFSWLAIKSCTCLAGAIPLSWNYFFGKILGNIAYLTVGRHRRVAIDSLAIAFPQSSPAQRKRIARDFFIFMSQTSFELLHFLKNPQLLKNIRIEGREYLDEALAKGRGVIILTGHLGNFPLMSLKLAKVGYSVHFVTRPMRDEKASDYIHKLRTDAGVKTIFSFPRKECVQAILAALRNNELVVIQMDQNFGTGGVWVKFFGKLAATPVGPITLALRTKAAIVPAYIVRQEMGRHCIKIFPQEDLVVTANKDETILLSAIKFTRIIESWVKAVGYQWGWIHRRWKSQPSKKVRNLRFKIEK